MHKRQKVVTSHSAVNNIFQFLCNPIIDKKQETTTLIPMICFETIVRSANTHWKGSSRVNLNFNPFATMASTLLQSKYHPLTHKHHHLLLEEMMLLNPGSDFVCAVSTNHYFLQHSQSKSSFKECLVTAPTQPLIVDRKTFFTIEMSVSSNPKFDEFKYGTMGSREEIACQCTKREGCGLNCILSATGKPFLLSSTT